MCILYKRFDFTTVKIQVVVFWTVTPCRVVVGYLYFGGPYCHHLQVYLQKRKKIIYVSIQQNIFTVDCFVNNRVYNHIRSDICTVSYPLLDFLCAVYRYQH